MTRTLVVTGGHPFEPAPWNEVWASMPFPVEHMAQPEALERIVPGRVDADVVIFYDMPGLRFTRDPSDPLERIDPPSGYLDGLRRLLAGDGCERVGMVFLHHAVASWPASEEFAELVGGRFHYQPGTLRGVEYPDSGYVFDVRHTVEVLDTDHPICAGLPASFELTDELYRFPVFEESVTPLMRTTYPINASTFFSADLAIRGERNSDRGWSHPDGSDLVAWTRDVDGGRLAYLQFGDGPVTYADPTFRQILANAVAWAAAA
ncbi:MAG: ThuA domain-containing protein [Ilumatobacter sp.]|jgi:uncharacterized protein|uniref:ThuA domain-containing protein n=1 Tax=Ilumatobacter sp. TaxID=1967498 RepID=UPI003919672C